MSPPATSTPEFPARFVDLKRKIIPEETEALTHAWNEILVELSNAVKEIEQKGPEIIPQVDFKDLQSLTSDSELMKTIKRRGCVVIRNIVEDEKAVEWKQLLKDYAAANPQVDGFPADNKQFFEIYWSRSQLEARSHPNVLAASTFLNRLFHVPNASEAEGLSLDTPLSYADRFRIRQPGPFKWTVHNPHIDGGSIERWEDDEFREGCYRNILDGKWKDYDAYDISGRLKAHTNIYGRPNQSSVFRTWQGWLAMSDTRPTEGTIRFFPDVLLSSSYLLLRPFFSPIQPRSSFSSVEGFLAPNNWRFDNSNTDFPGITPMETEGGGIQFSGQRLDELSHPHMRVEGPGMVSVPHVLPGDMVFWHCDVVHAVEPEHTGAGDSSVMYIPAVPLTPLNASYIAKQAKSFLAGLPPPDFPQQTSKAEGERGEQAFKGRVGPEVIGSGETGKRAMGLVA